jgi:hypothetical protein
VLIKLLQEIIIMATQIEVHKGLPVGTWTIYGDINGAYMTGPNSLLKTPTHRLDLSEIHSIIPLDDNLNVNVKGGIGAGLVGGMLFGPIGAVAGAALGGNGRCVTFKAFTENGSFIATIDKKKWATLLATIE